ncbi:hypothetical protein M9H77_03979 [Catharanthus roseus]|uniref:Uncharacterized protein n=1 Tax=Catharanthus roseus TaxID=4058 RepID=A0ACC0CD94_CATRO|nr:hypothetical protein M9H77_03979 [Catharanthus roseus]
MVELIDKPILAEKMITQESFEQYNVMELLLRMGYVELALFAKQYNDNLAKEFYANLTEEFGILRAQLMVKDLSLSSDSWTRELDPLVMVLLSQTPSTQGHIGSGRSTRQQSSRKKQPSTKLASLSPPLPSAESSKVTTSLNLLNQKLSNVMASVLQMQHKSYGSAAALCISIVLGNLINPEESVIMSCDTEVQLRKVESIKRCQNPKKNKTYRESKL